MPEGMDWPQVGEFRERELSGEGWLPGEGLQLCWVRVGGVEGDLEGDGWRLDLEMDGDGDGSQLSWTTRWLRCRGNSWLLRRTSCWLRMDDRCWLEGLTRHE